MFNFSIFLQHTDTIKLYPIHIQGLEEYIRGKEKMYASDYYEFMLKVMEYIPLEHNFSIYDDNLVYDEDVFKTSTLSNLNKAEVLLKDDIDLARNYLGFILIDIGKILGEYDFVEDYVISYLESGDLKDLYRGDLENMQLNYIVTERLKETEKQKEVKMVSFSEGDTDSKVDTDSNDKPNGDKSVEDKDNIGDKDYLLGESNKRYKIGVEEMRKMSRDECMDILRRYINNDKRYNDGHFRDKLNDIAGVKGPRGLFILKEMVNRVNRGESLLGGERYKKYKTLMNNNKKKIGK